MSSLAELHWLGVKELGTLFRTRELSPVEVTEATLRWIETTNGVTRSFVTVLAEEALAEANVAEQAFARGEDIGPMQGVTYSVKDVIAVKGAFMRCGSKVTNDFLPTSDAHVVTRMRSGGAVCLGKVATHEFSWGVTSPPARNPWDGRSVPGGSSGGSGAAVAAGQGTASIGADCGCSVRNPAALNGICGLRPTHGRVSTTGAVPLSMTMDTVGPLARSAEDTALLLQVMAGHDPEDPSSSSAPVSDFTSQFADELRGLRIGVPTEYFFEHIEAPVKQRIEEAIEIFHQLGAEVKEVAMPHAKYAVGSALFVIAESAAWFDDYSRERAAEFGVDVQNFIELGNLLLAKDYCRAQQVRSLIQRDFDHAFREVDVIVTPATAATAKPPEDHEIFIDVKYPDGHREDVARAYCRFTIPVSMAGCPALIVPCGFSDDGLPVGMQIVAPMFDEVAAFHVGFAFQQTTEWHRMRPTYLTKAAG